MKSVFEFAAKHIEPSLKRALILKLLSKNVNRTYIAKCTGVSPALITRYAKGERGLHDLTAIREIDEALKELSDKITNGEMCGSEVYIRIAELTMYVLSKKFACGIHYLATRDIDPLKCNICPSIFKISPQVETN
ncbi:MAG: XRE family transcriptional regulator [Desulfurococcales archaeon]|nr:XRE family transcriptional regulator [Desulfurococcales archaeon]